MGSKSSDPSSGPVASTVLRRSTRNSIQTARAQDQPVNNDSDDDANQQTQAPTSLTNHQPNGQTSPTTTQYQILRGSTGSSIETARAQDQQVNNDSDDDTNQPSQALTSLTPHQPTAQDQEVNNDSDDDANQQSQAPTSPITHQPNVQTSISNMLHQRIMDRIIPPGSMVANQLRLTLIRRRREARARLYTQHPDMPEPYTLPAGTLRCPVDFCSYTIHKEAHRLNEHMKRIHGWPRGRAHEIQPRMNASATGTQQPTTTTPFTFVFPAGTVLATTPIPARTPRPTAPATAPSPPTAPRPSRIRDTFLENELQRSHLMPAFRAATRLAYPVVNTLIPYPTARAAVGVTLAAAAAAVAEADAKAAAAVVGVTTSAGTPPAPTSRRRSPPPADFNAEAQARLRHLVPGFFPLASAMPQRSAPAVPSVVEGDEGVGALPVEEEEGTKKQKKKVRFSLDG